MTERFVCEKGKLWKDWCREIEFNKDEHGRETQKCITSHVEPVRSILGGLERLGHIANGCNYGQPDGPDDTVKECDCE